jgi:post-segregation antitoxin (ccd killing protein)
MKHCEAHRDKALAKALCTEQCEQWLAKNSEAMNACNQDAEAQGVFGDNVRSF